MKTTEVKHKYDRGQDVWFLSYGRAKEEMCPKCEGHSSTIVNDIEYTCSKCDGRGTIDICRKEVAKAKIEEIVINLWVDMGDKVAIKYSTGGFGNWFENDGEDLYPTQEEAQAVLETIPKGD